MPNNIPVSRPAPRALAPPAYQPPQTQRMEEPPRPPSRAWLWLRLNALDLVKIALLAAILLVTTITAGTLCWANWRSYRALAQWEENVKAINDMGRTPVPAATPR